MMTDMISIVLGKGDLNARQALNQIQMFTFLDVQTAHSLTFDLFGQTL